MAQISGPRDIVLLMLYLYNISLLSNVKCNMTYELMLWSSMCHQIPCKSHFSLFLLATVNVLQYVV